MLERHPNLATAVSFHIHSNSIFTDHSIIRRYEKGADSIGKEITGNPQCQTGSGVHTAALYKYCLKLFLRGNSPGA
jgi:hypothetical protein